MITRSVLGICALLLTAASVTGQKNFTVYYNTLRTLPDTTATVLPGDNFELDIQDSIAYCYYPAYDFHPEQGKAPVPLGSGFWPKSVFMSFPKKIRIFQEGYFGKPRTHRLVVRKMEKVKWDTTGEKKRILGYDCFKATGFTEKGAVIAWYAPQLPSGFGPFQLTSLPGTILEYEYMSQYIRTVTVATEILNESLPVVEPNFCKRTKYFTSGR